MRKLFSPGSLSRRKCFASLAKPRDWQGKLCASCNHSAGKTRSRTHAIKAQISFVDAVQVGGFCTSPQTKALPHMFGSDEYCIMDDHKLVPAVVQKLPKRPLKPLEGVAEHASNVIVGNYTKRAINLVAILRRGKRPDEISISVIIHSWDADKKSELSSVRALMGFLKTHRKCSCSRVIVGVNWVVNQSLFVLVWRFSLWNHNRSRTDILEFLEKRPLCPKEKKIMVRITTIQKRDLYGAHHSECSGIMRFSFTVWEENRLERKKEL